MPKTTIKITDLDLQKSEEKRKLFIDNTKEFISNNQFDKVKKILENSTEYMADLLENDGILDRLIEAKKWDLANLLLQRINVHLFVLLILSANFSQNKKLQEIQLPQNTALNVKNLKTELKAHKTLSPLNTEFMKEIQLRGDVLETILDEHNYRFSKATLIKKAFKIACLNQNNHWMLSLWDKMPHADLIECLKHHQNSEIKKCLKEIKKQKIEEDGFDAGSLKISLFIAYLAFVFIIIHFYRLYKENNINSRMGGFLLFSGILVTYEGIMLSKEQIKLLRRSKYLQDIKDIIKNEPQENPLTIEPKRNGAIVPQYSQQLTMEESTQEERNDRQKALLEVTEDLFKIHGGEPAPLYSTARFH